MKKLLLKLRLNVALMSQEARVRNAIMATTILMTLSGDCGACVAETTIGILLSSGIPAGPLRMILGIVNTVDKTQKEVKKVLAEKESKAA